MLHLFRVAMFDGERKQEYFKRRDQSLPSIRANYIYQERFWGKKNKSPTAIHYIKYHFIEQLLGIFYH